MRVAARQRARARPRARARRDRRRLGLDLRCSRASSATTASTARAVGRRAGADASGSTARCCSAAPASSDVAADRARHRIDRVILAGTRTSPRSSRTCVRRAHQLGLKVDYLPHPLDVVGARGRGRRHRGRDASSALNPPVLVVARRGRSSAPWTSSGALGPARRHGAADACWSRSRSSSTRAGPVLFRQERDRARRPAVPIVKFRTMVDGAEAMAEELRARQPRPALAAARPRPARSRASAGCCAGPASTSCRSSGTCSGAT